MTCPYHFHLMGNRDALSRRAAGLVHPSIIETDEKSSSPRRHSDPGTGESAGNTEPQHTGNAAGEQPPRLQHADNVVGDSSIPVSTARPAHDNTSATLAAISAVVETERAAAQVERTAMQAQLKEHAATTRRLLSEQKADSDRRFDEMMAALRTLTGTAGTATQHTAAHSTTAAIGAKTVNAALSAPRPIAAPTVLPSPHRHAVLDRVTTAPRSLNPFASLAHDELDDDGDEVITQSHTLLPSAFRPTPAGTEQSAQQQLAAIVNGLSKQGGKVKYASIAELNEALDDWAASSLAEGWTARQVESIRAYQRLLVSRFAVSEHKPLKAILEYHRKWCKAVDVGTIDMFAPGAELNLSILYDVDHPLQFGGAASATPTTPAKTGGAKGPASAAGSDAKPVAAKYPAGSCTKHPASTSHTTAGCRQK